MLGSSNIIHCAKCGKYLFTETDTEKGYKRTDDKRNYHYDENLDIFLCDECDKNTGYIITSDHNCTKINIGGMI